MAAEAKALTYRKLVVNGKKRIKQVYRDPYKKDVIGEIIDGCFYRHQQKKSEI